MWQLFIFVATTIIIVVGFLTVLIMLLFIYSWCYTKIVLMRSNWKTIWRYHCDSQIQKRIHELNMICKACQGNGYNRVFDDKYDSNSAYEDTPCEKCNGTGRKTE